MAETDQDQKTEQASDKKLTEAHERGQFAKSHELSVLFPIAATIGVLTLTMDTMTRDIAQFAAGMFSRFGKIAVGIDTVPVQLLEVLMVSGVALGPFLFAIVGAIILAGGIQSGFRMTPEALTFKFESLDVIAGFGRLFSKTVLVRSGLDLLKLLGIGVALWVGARSLIFDPLFSAPVEAAYLGQFLNQATLLFLTRLLFALGVVAAISLAYERFKISRELMMTKEEVKEEHKQAEGNAQAKSAMRRMGRRLVQKQMLDAVKTADVIVTNPTHFAVALKYERGKDQAPVILAKGENRFAQRIKALGAEHGVPLVENKPVARLLFAMGKVGETIPAEMYAAVASILSVVYRTHRYYFYTLKSRRLAEGSTNS